ncbi:MAG: WYL domain-containing protein [Clostridiales bacterium]|nr:WYL domain-containing protein [Clostridiales bacterium]
MPAPVKKLVIMNILDILRRYSDENHRLSQRDIVEILHNEYDMTVERKTVKRNILNLMECGYDIEYSESVRMVPNRVTCELEESYIWSDFYLVRDFTDSELSLMIDSIMFFKNIPYSQSKELIKKIEGLSNKYFRSRIKNILTTPESNPRNQQLFYTIDTLDTAISHNRKVSFFYNSFELDKKLHPKQTPDGENKLYTVSPYQIAAVNGRYYLICNTDPHDDVSHYRLDRITEIKMTDGRMREAKTVKGLENGVNLPKHMAEHLYMFSGASEPVRFRMKKQILNDVIDWFGTDITFSDESEDEVTARVEVNLQAMRLWSVQYGPYVKVISPKMLAKEVKNDLQTALKQYEE